MKSFLPLQVSEKKIAIITLVVVLALPFVLSFNPYYLSIFISALILGSVSLAWNLLAGGCGQVSFGHAAFFGIGAYASALLVMKAGWNPFLAMVVAAVIGVIGALIIGIPAFRLRGPYFALSVLGFAEVMKLLTLNLTRLTEGSKGIFNISSLPRSHGGLTLEFYISRTTNYYFAAVLMFVIYLVIYLFRHSNTGLAMSGVHGMKKPPPGSACPFSGLRSSRPRSQPFAPL